VGILRLGRTEVGSTLPVRRAVFGLPVFWKGPISIRIQPILPQIKWLLYLREVTDVSLSLLWEYFACFIVSTS